MRYIQFGVVLASLLLVGHSAEAFPATSCCFSNGSCQNLDSGDCQSAGGHYQEGSCADRGCERPHSGWNHVSTEITLTKNEPAYWSAMTGMPKGVAPFTVLDPGGLPGRPDPDGSGDRVLRGYILAWAVGADNREIRWNHLKGDVLLINYRDHAAWEYNAWAFQVVSDVANGEPTRVSPAGQLNLDGSEYTPVFDHLMLDFYADGSSPFAGQGHPTGDMITVHTDLTLHPVSTDLRQEDDGPVTTKAKIDVWNENEVKFNGTERCISCWDQTLLANFTAFGVPNNFLYTTLQTIKGKARIVGLRSDNCDFDYEFDPDVPFGDDPRDIVSQDAALLGVAAKLIHMGDIHSPLMDMAGMNLTGMGTESAVILYDTLDAPPEAAGESTLSRNRPRRGTGRSAPAPVSDAEGVGSSNGPDRVSGSEKGSLLVFSKIEIRWDSQGKLIQDTFVDITNDLGEDVMVQMYFINGDAPIPGGVSTIPWP